MGIRAISRLDSRSFDSLLAKQDVQGGIRDVIYIDKESNIVREGRKTCATNFGYVAPNTIHHFRKHNIEN